VKIDKQKLLEWLQNEADDRESLRHLKANRLSYLRVKEHIETGMFDAPDRPDVATIKQHDEMLHSVFGQIQEAHYGRVVGD
jgi:hypothetical protein